MCVDTIADHVEHTSSNVESGNEHLLAAARYQVCSGCNSHVTGCASVALVTVYYGNCGGDVAAELTQEDVHSCHYPCRSGCCYSAHYLLVCQTLASSSCHHTCHMSHLWYGGGLT